LATSIEPFTIRCHRRSSRRRDQDGDPNVLQNAINLTCTFFPGNGFDTNFRATYTGEAGQRNNFRGPGYFDIDGGLANWTFKEDKYLRFSWEFST
jgi:hypothetical protein